MTEDIIEFPGTKKRLEKTQQGAIYVDRLIQDDYDFYTITSDDGAVVIPEGQLAETIAAIIKKVPARKVAKLRKKLEKELL